MQYWYFVYDVFQLAHGADPSMKNQEGQTPLDLTTVSKLNPILNLGYYNLTDTYEKAKKPTFGFHWNCLCLSAKFFKNEFFEK